MYPQANAAPPPAYNSREYGPPPVAPASTDLSGEWRSQSGGIFDMSQSGNHVVWNGHSEDGYTWQNHFEGDISGNYLNGYFEDLASGRNRNSGPLTFRIEGSQLIRVNPTRAFSDTVLMRGDVYAAQNGRYGSPQQQYAPVQQPAARSAPMTKLDQAVDKLVSFDSRTWAMNRYDYGSAHDSQLIDTSGAKYTVSSQYTFNSGRPGWVRIRFDGKTPQCVEFWDFAGDCRAIGHSPGRSLLLGAVAIAASAAMSDSGGSGGGSPSAEVQREEQERQLQDGINANRQIQQSDEMQGPE